MSTSAAQGRFEVSIRTGSNSETIGEDGHRSLPELHVTPDTMDHFWVFSPARWKGQHVWVGNSTRHLDDPMWLAAPLCAPYEHDLYPMVHHGPNCERWPTGFLSCAKCMGTAHEPGVFT